MPKPVIYHIPVCPFSQRIEILLALKDLSHLVDFHVVDITKPRENWLLKKTGGTTSLPILETEDGGILKESLIILRYIEERFGRPPVARIDPFERGVERMMIAREGQFGTAGYRYVMNQDASKSAEQRRMLLEHYSWLDNVLLQYNPDGTWLFEQFGLAEVVYTPLIMRFWFLEHYEDFFLPETQEFERVSRWRQACLEHPAAQQVSRDQIIKLYYDYAVGSGNGALPEGRQRSSFVFEPHWRDRPIPPRDKYNRIASDSELGLV
jgi:glutathione S-transferase